MTDLLSSPRLRASRASSSTAPTGPGSPTPPTSPPRPDLARARDEAERLLADHGVTYGADQEDGEHPWHLDPLPVIVDEPEWARLDAALVQRAELLDAILQDVYGHRRLLTDQLLPPTVVLGHPGFVRAVDGLRLPGGRELVLTATDLVRDGDGRVVRGRGPDAGAVRRRVRDGGPAGRLAGARPGVYRQASIQRLGPFFRALRLALRDVAPGHAEQPRVVLLTSGPASETAFDQAYLASMLGLPLVEGSDLLVRDGRVWMRGVEGLEPVDVVLRRVDAEWCDPLDLRQGSRLGRARAWCGRVRAGHGQRGQPARQLGAGEPRAAHLPAAAGARGARPGPRAARRRPRGGAASRGRCSTSCQPPRAARHPADRPRHRRRHDPRLDAQPPRARAAGRADHRRAVAVGRAGAGRAGRPDGRRDARRRRQRPAVGGGRRPGGPRPAGRGAADVRGRAPAARTP